MYKLITASTFVKRCFIEAIWNYCFHRGRLNPLTWYFSNIKTESVVFLCGHYTSIIAPLKPHNIYIFTSLFPSLLSIPLYFIHLYHYHPTLRLVYQTCLVNKWVSTRVVIVNGLSKYDLGFEKKLKNLVQWTWEHAKGSMV